MSTPPSADLGARFVEAGFTTTPVASRADLDAVRRAFVGGLRATIAGGDGLDDEAWINRFHEFADPARVNEARVKVIKGEGSSEPIRRAVLQCVKPALAQLIGPEIAMQRHVNLVVHTPGDTANLLYLHTDAWSGCSPYEVIAWIPLVDVFDSKSMYVVPRAKGQRHLEELKAGLELGSAEDLYARVKGDAEQLTMRYGEALLFSPTLLHGARVNETKETRMVLNVRFKALFSPYGTKTLGETFLPVSYLPASEVGLAYESVFGMVRG